jgi:hypothetical protein
VYQKSHIATSIVPRVSVLIVLEIMLSLLINIPVYLKLIIVGFTTLQESASNAWLIKLRFLIISVFL